MRLPFMLLLVPVFSVLFVSFVGVFVVAIVIVVGLVWYTLMVTVTMAGFLTVGNLCS